MKGSSRTSRRKFLQAGVAAPLSLTLLHGGAKADSAAKRRPNILLFTSDDQGKLDLGCYGNDRCTTPNLDRLAKQGARLTRAFTPTAICTPSRACLLTGLYPHTSGAHGFLPIKPGIETLPLLMSRAGYRTGIIGKVHVGPDEQFPFDFRIDARKLDAGRNIAQYAEAVSAFLEGTKDKPFWLMVNYCDPHRPFPEKGVTKGKKAEVPDSHDPNKALIPPFLIDTRETRIELARYYDAIRRMDTGVGLVLRILEAAGHADNTLVMFTSDNGMPFPFAKTTLYDAGINMPFLVRWPGVLKPGSVIDAMISFIDVLPTCLNVAEAPVPASIQGRSFLPVLRGQSKELHNVIFATHTDHARRPRVPSRAIRTHRHKYIYNFRPDLAFKNNAMNSLTWRSMLERAKTNKDLAVRVRLFQHRPRHELFDLRSDPHELRNLAGDPESANMLAHLRARLMQWMSRVNDPFLPEMKQQLAEASSAG